MKQSLFTKSTTIFLSFAIVVLAFTSCKKDMMGAQSNLALDNGSGNIIGTPGGDVFNVTMFKNNLRNALGTQPKGYSFVITKDGLVADSFSLGSASFVNNVANPQHTNREINIASVTKTMTAVAALQLMALRGETVDSAIGQYLPKSWNIDPAIASLTFGQLLSHRSGITTTSFTWATLRTTVSNPPQGNANSRVYSNMNFSLFRVILPYMENKAECLAKENPSAGFQTWLANRYVQIMQENVFSPIGLGVINCKPSSSTAWMMNEPANANGVAAVAQVDWTEMTGGGGLYMSPMEMARFMVYLTQTNTLVNATQRNQMDNLLIGWDPEDSPMTEHGQAYGKDGALWQNINVTQAQDAGDAGLQTFVMKFPNKVQLSLAINSIPGPYRILAPMITKAFNDAWVKP